MCQNASHCKPSIFVFFIALVKAKNFSCLDTGSQAALSDIGSPQYLANWHVLCYPLHHPSSKIYGLCQFYWISEFPDNPLPSPSKFSELLFSFSRFLVFRVSVPPPLSAEIFLPHHQCKQIGFCQFGFVVFFLDPLHCVLGFQSFPCYCPLQNFLDFCQFSWFSVSPLFELRNNWSCKYLGRRKHEKVSRGDVQLKTSSQLCFLDQSPGAR